MRDTTSYILLGIIGILIISLSLSCANQIQLTGGPKDEVAPILDTSLSTPNYQTYYKKDKIELFFDEFIDLKDPVKQIIVTPPLDYFPSVDARLKKVTFEFDEQEVLKEDVTYVINFGESIADFTESNKLENFTIVFSTGGYIDSLSIQGEVKDVLTDEGVEGYLVMLYESTLDSVVYQEKPFYFAKTLENGIFEIKNLRADTFKLFVLNDKNVNYTYDPGEEIGFIDELIYLDDTSRISLNLQSFLEFQESRYIGYDALNLGLIEIEFDKYPPLDSLNIVSTSIDKYSFIKSDPYKVDFFYSPSNLNKIEIQYLQDTLSFRVNNRSIQNLDTTVLLTAKLPKADVGIHPLKPLILTANYPLDTFNNSNIYIRDTLTGQNYVPKVSLISDDPMGLAIHSNWPSNGQLTFDIAPGLVRDIWGHTNDSISLTIDFASEEDYGTINIDFQNVPSDTSYNCTLVYGDEDLETFNVRLDTIYTFQLLEPGDYRLEVFEDINLNGRWDPGQYIEKKQSEKIFKPISLESVKGNWTIESIVDIKQIKSQNDTP